MSEARGVTAEEYAALVRVLALLESMGSANDAEDHGYLESAEHLRGEALEGIRTITAECPAVTDALPGLAAELGSGHVLGLGWADLAAQVRAYIRATCEICTRLAGEEHGYQKFGSPDNDIDLPPAAGRLKVVRELSEGGSRERTLMRCPLCGTRYLYTTDYEYLTNGTEDEQTLRRLADDAADALEG